MQKFIVWIKERGSPWEEQGEGPLTKAQADRIASEIRKECGCPTRVLPVGMNPNDSSRVSRQEAIESTSRKLLSKLMGA